MSAEKKDEEFIPDYSKFNEDSVPPPEEKKPDLDYDETAVGPAPGVEYTHKQEAKEKKTEK